MVARQAIRRNGHLLVADSRQQAAAWINRIAPEHLTVDEDDLAEVRCAGSIFIGDYSPQSAGDYASGPNHVLPTAGAARFRGGLSVHDFLKIITVQRFDANGLGRIAPVITALAEAEGLHASRRIGAREVRPCLARGRRSRTCRNIIRRWRVGMDCGSTLTRIPRDAHPA